MLEHDCNCLIPSVHHFFKWRLIMILDRDLVPDKKKKQSRLKMVGFLSAGVLAAYMASLLLHFYYVFPIVISNNEMESSIKEGQTVYVFRVFSQKDLTIGRVVLLRHPKNDDLYMVRRIAALPADRFRLEDGKIILNDHPLPFDQRALLEGKAIYGKYTLPAYVDSRDNTGEILIPENSVYVLADNRTEGVDSRDLGPVSMDRIVGVIWQ